MPTSETGKYLHVRISKATHVVWEGEAISISSNNPTGPFDILPNHTNFITYIENNSAKIVDASGTLTEHPFTKAVLYVEDNNVYLYMDI